jgi:hypothetical protein
MTEFHVVSWFGYLILFLIKVCRNGHDNATRQNVAVVYSWHSNIVLGSTMVQILAYMSLILAEAIHAFAQSL